MHNLEPIADNETRKIFWNFELQMDILIPASRPDLVLNNKKRRIWHLVDFVVPLDRRVKRNRQERQIPARDLKWQWNVEIKVVSFVVGASGNTPKASKLG